MPRKQDPHTKIRGNRPGRPSNAEREAYMAAQAELARARVESAPSEPIASPNPVESDPLDNVFVGISVPEETPAKSPVVELDPFGDILEEPEGENEDNAPITMDGELLVEDDADYGDDEIEEAIEFADAPLMPTSHEFVVMTRKAAVRCGWTPPLHMTTDEIVEQAPDRLGHALPLGRECGSVQWECEVSPTGVFQATDPDGWFRATMDVNGKFEFIKFGSPNLHNRRPGQRVLEDVRFAGEDWDDVMDTMAAFNCLAHAHLERYLCAVRDAQDAEQSRLLALEHAVPTQAEIEHGRMLQAAMDRGLITDKFKGDEDALVRKLASYYGIATHDDDGGTKYSRKMEDVRREVLHSIASRQE